MKITIEINDKAVNVVKSVFTKRTAIIGIVALFFIGGVFVFSQAITKPHDFSTGEVISAEAMNENFDTLYTKVNELDREIITAHSFGEWDDTRSFDTVYRAETDGFVVGICSGNGDTYYTGLRGDTEANESPGIIRGIAYTKRENGISIIPSSSFTMPVKKGDYWRVIEYIESGIAKNSLYWIPLGN